MSLSSSISSQRITIFIPSLHGGGAERVMVTLANAFASRGHAVDLVLGSATGPYLDHVADNVRIIDLQCSRIIMSLIPLARYLAREQPISLLSAMTHANIVALTAIILARVKTRIIVSERTTIAVAAATERNWIARITYALVPWLYSRADNVVAVSKAAADSLEKFAGLTPKTVNVIYNPFDLDRIDKCATKGINHPWFAEHQPPVILAIGRLTASKDYTTLIRAFAQLRLRRRVRLLILGEGEARESLERLVNEYGLTADDVQMPGFVPNPFAYLARSQVFVLSSRFEGLPGVLIEAMACGVPVVSTDCPSGPFEILEGGRWGILVQLDDVNALCDAIDKVLSTPREELPDVRIRSLAFEQEASINAYLNLLYP